MIKKETEQARNLFAICNTEYVHVVKECNRSNKNFFLLKRVLNLEPGGS
jgi:hypothetical protein